LRHKYHVEKAFYYLGAFDLAHQDMYANIQSYGFITLFREHSAKLTGRKKGNVDTDIVFDVMRSICENDDFDKVILVSGDGDYKRMVDWLIERERFLKLLLPCKDYASSLYNRLEPKYYDYIDRPDMRVKIGFVETNGRSPKV
jgi:uncharacterized LabA/DUF88 family protein